MRRGNAVMPVRQAGERPTGGMQGPPSRQCGGARPPEWDGKVPLASETVL